MSKVKLNAASGGGSVSFEGPASSASDKVIKYPSAATALIQAVQTWDYTHVVLANNGDNYSQLNTNITPTSTASRILVMISMGLVSSNGAADIGWSLQRDSTYLGVPSGTGGTVEATFAAFMNQGSGDAFSTTLCYIDSPSTTSQVTYKVISRANSARDMVINRRNSDNSLRGSSFMQLLELA